MFWYEKAAAQGFPCVAYRLGRIFRENSVPPAAPMGQRVDRKLRRKIQKKKIAMGHKPDDHEETPRQDMGDMTMGW